MRTLYSDNATVNGGHISSLRELMNEERKECWRALPEVTRGNFKALIFKGCDDHIAALTLKHFDQALVQLAQVDGSALPWLAHKKKLGKGCISLPFHLLKLLSKRLLGVHRSSWFYAKQMHDEQNPHGQKHPPQIIQCSLGRNVYSGFNTVFLPLLLLAVGVGFPAACF